MYLQIRNKYALHSGVDALCFDTDSFWDFFFTDLQQDTDEQTGNCEQNNVLCQPGQPQGTVMNAHSTQHILQPELLLKHQVFDGHAHGVYKGQHDYQRYHGSDLFSEAGC